MILILDYLPEGNLFQVIWKTPYPSREELKKIFVQICKGVKYLH